jgi:hypothetical protein
MTRIRTSKLFILSSINFLITFSMIFTNTIKAEVNGRMIITSITSEKVSVLLQLNTSAAPDAMGGATMVIGFDTSSISFKANPVTNTDYTFHNFCGGNYSSATITRPFSNRIWINIDLPFDHVNNGTVVEGGNNWTDVVTINFDVKNSHGFASVFWITNSVFWGIYDDDNITFWNTGQFRDVTNIPLPVELTSFKATIKKDKVLLEWLTMTEVDNYGFDIERSVNNSEWEKIGFVKGSGNSNSQKSYSFVDDQLTGGTEFRYRLKQIDTDGSFDYSEILKVEYLPQIFKLYQNYPNPFNPTTKIRYSVPRSSNVTIKVYDILGNEIATLVNGEQEAGTYEVEFDAAILPSGIYFYKLQAGLFVETKKMILLR